jgi:hypothetical protein
MTPWSRVNQALSVQQRDWKWLADRLGLKIQAVNHWERRGIPARHHTKIEQTLDQPRGWVAGDVMPFEAPSELSPSAIEIAVLFDMIPSRDRIRRAQAFNLATAAIMQVLQSASANGPASPGQQTPTA